MNKSTRLQELPSNTIRLFFKSRSRSQLLMQLMTTPFPKTAGPRPITIGRTIVLTIAIFCLPRLVALDWKRHEVSEIAELGQKEIMVTFPFHNAGAQVVTMRTI